jgi:PAS domain S-box-containing protein
MAFQPQHSPALILNVDHEEAGRNARSRLLEREGFTIIEAANGAQALELAAVHDPDAILLNVYLPDGRGDEVCRRLRAQKRTALTPVLYVTARDGSQTSQLAGIEAGGDDYLIDPVDPGVLAAKIRHFSRLRQRTRELERVSRETMIPEADSPAEALPGFLFIATAERGCEYVNRWWCEYTGLTAAQSLGYGWLEAMHPEDRKRTEELWRQAATSGQPFSSEHRYRGKAGGYHYFRVSAAPVRDAATGAVRTVCVGLDIQDQRLAEAAMREAERQDTLSNLAGGVAHNLNNMLVGVMGTASFIAGDAPPPIREALHDIIRASQRAADLTAQLLAYAGRGQHLVSVTDLSEMAAATVPLIEAIISRGIRLELQLGRRLPAVEVDRAQIRQLIMGLIMNAAEAIGSAPGVIGLRTAAGRRAGAAPEDYVLLEVRDTGCGMDEATRARAFEPFFTTKFTGRGLGLAAAGGIVRTHKGSIEVISAPGQGSTFRVYFPAARTSEPAPPLFAGAGRAILIVDDEEAVLSVASVSIQRAGYVPLVARDGSEGVELFRARRGEVALVLLDLVMPNMDGVAALREIRAIRPDVPVLVSSGYQEEDVLEEFQTERVDGFLQKPYTSQRLLASIEEVLSGDSAAQNAGAR